MIGALFPPLNKIFKNSRLWANKTHRSDKNIIAFDRCSIFLWKITDLIGIRCSQKLFH